jgi:DNA-binding transcriptional regulator GbsR (MarR family)
MTIIGRVYEKVRRRKEKQNEKQKKKHICDHVEEKVQKIDHITREIDRFHSLLNENSCHYSNERV